MQVTTDTQMHVFKAADSAVDQVAQVPVSGTPDDTPEEAPKTREEWLRRHRRGQTDVVVTDEPEQERVYREHQGANRQYMRDMILGANDGLVSMFLLVLGLAGGGLNTKALLLAGITGAVAGAISMALGEYLATKSQAEVYSGDIELEKEHFKYFRSQEIAQLRAILQNDLMLEGQLLEQAVDKIGNNDEALLKIMMAFEFGLNENDTRSPVKAMMVSGGLFIGGSLPSWIPFAFAPTVAVGVYISLALSAIALFVVGAAKTIMTRGSWLAGGMENLLIGAIGGAVSYAVGVLYEHVA